MLPQGMGGALKVPKPIQGFKLSQNIYLSNVESNIFSQLEIKRESLHHQSIPCENINK
jgi:hypothetical protein